MAADVPSLLDVIKRKKPVLASLLEKDGKKSLGEFTHNFKKTSSFNDKSIQDRKDLINITTSYIESLIGEEIAEKLRARLTSNANLLTANHHCVNISDLPVQGTITFALSEKSDWVLPVFAFGDIPLNNSRYPRGLLLANDIKLPIFPDKLKNTLVSVAPPLTEEFVNKAIQRAGKLFKDRQITYRQFETSKFFLEAMYLNQKVLSCKSYSDQSVIISNMIWKKLFAQDTELRNLELIHLEIEKIVGQLLILDLDTKESLAYQMFFNERLRNNLLCELNGKNGCWDLGKLGSLLTNNHNSESDFSAGSGTIFFWGIDEKGRRIPLNLIADNSGFSLVGTSDSMEKYQITFTPESIKNALKKKQLIPSLFISFAVVSFARGYKCYGGFMQVDYLTEMRNGLAKALSANFLSEWSEIVLSLQTENYCTGMIFTLFFSDENIISPASAIEIASTGGLTREELSKIRSISLEDSNLFGLPRIYRTVFRPDERTEELSSITPMDIYSYKSDNFIVIKP